MLFGIRNSVAGYIVSPNPSRQWESGSLILIWRSRERKIGSRVPDACRDLMD